MTSDQIDRIRRARVDYPWMSQRGFAKYISDRRYMYFDGDFGIPAATIYSAVRRLDRAAKATAATPIRRSRRLVTNS